MKKIIWITSYPKSGNTWMRFLIANYFFNKSKEFDFNIIINPISSENYFQRATRPKYSVLDNSKIINTFNIKQIDYLDSLRRCIKILKNES